MTTAFAIVALLLGLIVVLGQLISVIDFRLAQRLGLQEKDEDTEPVYRHLELNTARWDVAVSWTLLLTGVAMLVDTSWWPWVALVTGGAHADAGGREVFKHLALRAEQIRVGTAAEARTVLRFNALIAAVGFALLGYSLAVVA